VEQGGAATPGHSGSPWQCGNEEDLYENLTLGGDGRQGGGIRSVTKLNGGHGGALMAW
jgi:hypothetical protein